jgi:hypothetical protein
MELTRGFWKVGADDDQWRIVARGRLDNHTEGMTWKFCLTNLVYNDENGRFVQLEGLVKKLKGVISKLLSLS